MTSNYKPNDMKRKDFIGIFAGIIAAPFVAMAATKTTVHSAKRSEAKMTTISLDGNERKVRHYIWDDIYPRGWVEIPREEYNRLGPKQNPVII